jgi:hypothetical protein
MPVESRSGSAGTPARACLVALLVGLALVLAGCAESGKLWLANDSDQSVIVQPAQPAIHEGWGHSAWLLAPKRMDGVPDDTYVKPGSVVRIFSEQCALITQFTFEDHSGAGQTMYALNPDGQISTSTLYPVMGDPGPAAKDHSPCPIP